jgi:hypothetical protein
MRQIHLDGKGDSHGVPAAIITTGQRRRVTTVRLLVSDNTGIPGGDGKYPGSVRHHPIHSFLTHRETGLSCVVGDDDEDHHLRLQISSRHILL